MRKLISTMVVLATAMFATNTLGASVVTGEIVIRAGSTNATELITLGGSDRLDAFELDRVFVITQHNTYTGTLSVALVDAGYDTVIGTSSAVLLSSPANLYPRRAHISSLGPTNEVLYVAKDLKLSMTVNGGAAVVDRKAKYVLYTK